jgi:hypothetical protein
MASLLYGAGSACSNAAACAFRHRLRQEPDRGPRRQGRQGPRDDASSGRESRSRSTSRDCSRSARTRSPARRRLGRTAWCRAIAIMTPSESTSDPSPARGEEDAALRNLHQELDAKDGKTGQQRSGFVISQDKGWPELLRKPAQLLVNRSGSPASTGQSFYTWRWPLVVALSAAA